jgi:hypothetical protein
MAMLSVCPPLSARKILKSAKPLNGISCFLVRMHCDSWLLLHVAQSFSEDKSPSAIQVIPHLLRKKNPLMFPVPSEPDESSSHPCILFYLILSCHLCIAIPCGIFPMGIPTRILYAFVISPVRAAGPTTALLDLFFEKHSIQISGSCSVSNIFYTMYFSEVQ